MTDNEKIEFRKLLADYTLMLSKSPTTHEVMQYLLALEQLIDKMINAELARVIGKNSKFRIN